MYSRLFELDLVILGNVVELSERFEKVDNYSTVIASDRTTDQLSCDCRGDLNAHNC